MTSPGIVVGPVNHPSLFIPFVLPVKIDVITDLQGLYTRRNIDIVGNKKGLIGVKLKDR